MTMYNLHLLPVILRRWWRRQLYGGIQYSPINSTRTHSSSETIFWVKTQNFHCDTAFTVETQNFQYETRFLEWTTFPLRNEICSKHRFLNCNLEFKLKLAICIYVYCRFRSLCNGKVVCTGKQVSYWKFWCFYCECGIVVEILNF